MIKLFKKLHIVSQLRSSLAIMVTAVVLLGFVTGIEYYYARKGLDESVRHNSLRELKATRIGVHGMLDKVETAVNNMTWAVERNLEHPDSMYSIIHALLKSTPVVRSAAVSFVPNYYPSKGRWFEPFAMRKPNGDIKMFQLGSQEHDYLNMDFHKLTVERGEPQWSEPYFDKDGVKIAITTYSCPIHDSSGRVVGALNADVGLDWLSERVNRKLKEISSFSMVLTRSGRLLTYPPNPSKVLTHSVLELSKEHGDTSINTVNRNMMMGKEGDTVISNKNGKYHIFYGPVHGSAGWSVAVVSADHVVYSDLRNMHFVLILLMLAGLALLGFIIHRSIKSQNRLRLLTSEKERIAGEISAASTIQQSMLQHTFPPYPERNDMELFATLEAAKQVSGDFYDFRLRNEKLYFCIGDVSGKGVPAALVMAVTRSLFRTASSLEQNPAKILANVNEAGCETNDANMFVTMFVGVLDLPTGLLRYCNAGHNAPYLLSHDGVQPLTTKANLPIGVMPGFHYVSQEIELPDDATIFLYTDGVTEAENEEREQYGEERLEKTLHTAAGSKNLSPQTLLDEAMASLRGFVDKAEQSDDITMLGVRYIKQEQHFTLSRGITITNSLSEIPSANAFVKDACTEVGFSEEEAASIKLAIEEAMVNVIDYAYPTGSTGLIKLEARASSSTLEFVLSDQGKAFDPTTAPNADTTLKAEDRPIGGLGIFLVRQIMDSTNYERRNGTNILTLKKQLPNKK